MRRLTETLLCCDWSGQLEEAVRFYQEALGLAQQAGDKEAVEQIQEGLKEVKRRRSQEKKEEQEEEPTQK